MDGTTTLHQVWAFTSVASLTVTASNKAVVAGRLLSTWQCATQGPGRAVADDPQQFLSFGADFGAGGTEATTQAALLLTALIRLLMFIVLIVTVRWKCVSIEK